VPGNGGHGKKHSHILMAMRTINATKNLLGVTDSSFPSPVYAEVVAAGVVTNVGLVSETSDGALVLISAVVTMIEPVPVSNDPVDVGRITTVVDPGITSERPWPAGTEEM